MNFIKYPPPRIFAAVIAILFTFAGCSNDEDKLRSDLRSVEGDLKEVEDELETTKEELKEVEGDLQTTEKDLQSAQNELRNREAAAVSATARKIFNAIERDRDFVGANHLRLTKNMKGLASGLIPNLTAEQGFDPDASNEQANTAMQNDQGVSSPSNTYLPTEAGVSPTRSLPSMAGWKGREYVSEHPDDRTTCVYPAGCLPGITDHVVIYTNQESDQTTMLIYGYWVREFDGGDENWFDVRPWSDIRQSRVTHANGVAKAKTTGTATYRGGTAGMYSLYRHNTAGSSSGHYTADATLEADFANGGNVSGELTNFMSEGQAMNWKVELLESSNFVNKDPISRARAGSNSGFAIDGSNHGFSNPENGTIWTISNVAADPSGSWYGDFWLANDNQADQTTVDNNPANYPTPESITGVFWAEHGEIGRMTGAFGLGKVDDN